MHSPPGVILQHADTGPPGRLGEWLRRRGIRYEVHRSWERSPAELDPSAYRFLASLGSAHSVNAGEPDWIAPEIALLRRAVDAHTPVLGLCWGGQALARALGATVGPAPAPEKGWLAIESGDPQIPEGPWLHYHGEIFAIPDGARELARSPAGPAAFRLGPHLALQFHPEADREIALGWARKDLGQTAATREAFAQQAGRWDTAAGKHAERLFDAWWESLSASTSGTAATGATGSGLLSG